MSLHPQSLRGRPSSGLSGDIDYRLARNAVVSDLKRGRMSRLDVCDAQPELLRAARNVGTSTGEDCPICEEAKVVLVSFAFGPRLPPSGRCLATEQELAKLSQRASELACYVVEVCPECSWNHLAKMFLVGGRYRA